MLLVTETSNDVIRWIYPEHNASSIILRKRKKSAAIQTEIIRLRVGHAPRSNLARIFGNPIISENEGAKQRSGD